MEFGFTQKYTHCSGRSSIRVRITAQRVVDQEADREVSSDTGGKLLTREGAVDSVLGAQFAAMLSFQWLP